MDPPDHGGALLETRASWTVLAGLRLAVLDRRFATVACRWPPVVENLLVRSLRHSRWLAGLLAINGPAARGRAAPHALPPARGPLGQDDA